ncbi:Pyruvate/Phosphoenolpyruvate kinase-like domain-containing protein [Lasiosphaeria hispida]|uniref:Pyruvate/Phosphoenolpyruvate kinase-like domain-containing protein n=1 Tax=Lasiosphaeria hispida TaxID=260671 RepID=A0AAJ0HU81_9PEZI|nr:Pyruvate/Phosphoenolpyruvate kinase-like domain-containing protein [Lasiosphaeria hispida]
MAAASSIIRRALLYVPASSPRFMAKTLHLKSDNVTFDLEDSVTPSEKAKARSNLHEWLSTTAKPVAVGELAVRINAITTPYAQADMADLAALPNLETIVVPKVNSAADLKFVQDSLRHAAPQRYSSGPGARPIRLIALIESAKAIMDLPSICAASPDLTGLIFAAEDFALDLSLTRTPELTEFLYARSAIVTAARAFNLPSTIDLVCTDYRGDGANARLERECTAGKGLGFNGKQCIHPSQVREVQRLFSPSEAEVDWAVRIVFADDKASAMGKGAWTLDGKMIDAPVVGKARDLLNKAAMCGIKLQKVKEKWRHQQPE